MQFLYPAKTDIILRMVDEMRTRSYCVSSFIAEAAAYVQDYFVEDWVDCYPNRSNPAIHLLLLGKGKYEGCYSS